MARSKKASEIKEGIEQATAAVKANGAEGEDIQQIAEETAHKLPVPVSEVKEKVMHLTLSAKSYFGPRKLWEKIFAPFGLDKTTEIAKLEVVEMSFPTAPDLPVDERIVHIRLKKKQ